MSDYSNRLREEARLIILGLLAEETSGTSNSSLLQAELESWGIAKTRDWVEAEVTQLAEIGAVTTSRVDSVLVVTTTARGLDHVKRRIVLPGVKRPSPPAV